MASAGQPDVFAWLWAFHGWCHAIDDFIDEPRHRHEAIDLCSAGVVLCSCPFYRRHAEVLGPVIGMVAEEYRASLSAAGVLADVLRVAGNHVVLVVAYITGGQALVRQVSDALWPIVHRTQFLEETPC
jgi:hypothetical protein